MYCVKCGAEIKDESAVFCAHCGQKINGSDRKTKNKKLYVFVAECVGALAIVIGIIMLMSKLLDKVQETDITHGGEEKLISDGEYTWAFDYNWAEYDEEWKGNTRPDDWHILGALFGDTDDMVSMLGGLTDADYIEVRLCPIGYNREEYWKYASDGMIESAEKQWKKYLDDHKELKGMYIVVNGEKLYPYRDDDFDKTYFMNPSTAVAYTNNDNIVLSSETSSDEYSVLDYEIRDDEMVDELDGWDESITFNLKEADGEFTIWACEVYDDGDNGYSEDYGEYDYDAFEGEMYAIASDKCDISFKVVYPDGTIYSDCPIDDYDGNGKYSAGICGISSCTGYSSDDEGNDIYTETRYGTYKIVMVCHDVKDVTVKFAYADDQYWKEGGSDFDYQIYAPGTY